MHDGIVGAEWGGAAPEIVVKIIWWRSVRSGAAGAHMIITAHFHVGNFA